MEDKEVIKYAAILTFCQRVGYENSQFFTRTKRFTGYETIEDIFQWANKIDNTKQSRLIDLKLVYDERE